MKVFLVLPVSGKVQSHEKTDRGDEICATIENEDGGMDIDIEDLSGKVLCQLSFGYNFSGTPGCTVTVCCHPTLPLILVSYDGYKFDHNSKLLFLTTNNAKVSIHEYSTAKKDILPYLKKQKNFPTDYEYIINPYRLTENGVEFHCIPLSKPEASHPFAQHQAWYSVSGIFDQYRKLTPTVLKQIH